MNGVSPAPWMRVAGVADEGEHDQPPPSSAIDGLRPLSPALTMTVLFGGAARMASIVASDGVLAIGAAEHAGPLRLEARLLDARAVTADVGVLRLRADRSPAGPAPAA